MKQIGAVIGVIFGIFLLLGAFHEPIEDGIKGWRTVDTTQSVIVTTGAGETSANVTLTSELFRETETEVISISSNITETPIATDYEASSQNLEVSALASSETRSLTINYYADSDSVVMQVVGGFLSFLITGFLIYCLAAGMFGGKKRRR